MIKICSFIDEKILTIYIKRDIGNPPWLKPSIFFYSHAYNTNDLIFFASRSLIKIYIAGSHNT